MRLVDYSQQELVHELVIDIIYFVGSSLHDCHNIKVAPIRVPEFALCLSYTTEDGDSITSRVLRVPGKYRPLGPLFTMYFMYRLRRMNLCS